MSVHAVTLARSQALRPLFVGAEDQHRMGSVTAVIAANWRQRPGTATHPAWIRDLTN